MNNIDGKIDHFRLAQLDLNLLIGFDAILSEGSVTKAARRLRINQSSLSYQLGRLREILKDELFVRTSAGMQPTPRGAALAADVKALLRQVEHTLLTEIPFDAKTTVRIFRLGLPDYLQSALLPPLLNTLNNASGNLGLEVVPIDRRRATDLLDSGEIDVAVGNVEEGGLLHKRRFLFADSYACLFNARFFERPISFSNYLRLPHVVVSLQESACKLVDEALDRERLRRTILLSTPHTHAVPDILVKIPVIATLPRFFADTVSPIYGLTTSPVPFKIDAFQISTVWHASRDPDPGLIWFRKQLVDAANSIALDQDASDLMTRRM